jgi:hypothetical protein
MAAHLCGCHGAMGPLEAAKAAGVQHVVFLLRLLA